MAPLTRWVRPQLGQVLQATQVDMPQRLELQPALQVIRVDMPRRAELQRVHQVIQVVVPQGLDLQPALLVIPAETSRSSLALRRSLLRSWQVRHPAHAKGVEHPALL